jgi:[acyl-carrier-protein] S-malonyltransferase
LAVAGAFHTSYMQPAVEPMRALAASIEVSDCVIGVLSNKDGAVLTSGREILDRIVNQIANPVRWDLCMQALADQGVTGVIEVAPAGTLVGLIKRAVPAIEQSALKSPTDIESANDFAITHSSNQARGI